MTLFFPDVNVWLALSVAGHIHHPEAWPWLADLSRGTAVLYCRFTQLGLLRLLTNPSVMGGSTHDTESAWKVYDGWLNDPRVQFHNEPRAIDAAFRQATASFASKPASKWIGDCYLMAFAKEAGATLVTFDKALMNLSRKHNCPAIIPGGGSGRMHRLT